MTVAEIIGELRKMPQDLDVLHVWDGAPRTAIKHVWLARDKSAVITADDSEVVYSAEYRPESAPGEEERYWYTRSSLPKDQE